MTITNNYVPVKVLGNGVTVNFGASWQIIAQGYERVYLQDTVTGAQTLQILGTNYSLVFDANGFTVTFFIAPPNTKYVVIGRAVSESQDVSFKTSTGFDGKVEENAFDKVTAMVQDTQEQVNRSLTFPLGSSAIGIIEDAPQDGYGLIWDGTSGSLRNTDSSLAVLEGNAAIVAADIANINIVAGDVTNINAVAANATNINTVAGSIANVNLVGASIANVNTVAGSIAAVNTVSTNIAAVNTAATNIAAIIAAPAAATAAAASATQASAAVVAVANQWAFATSVTMAAPGTGNVRLNNASAASVTAIAISALSNDSGNPNLNAFINTWDDSTHNPRGILTIAKNATNYAKFGISGALTDNTTWLQLAVSYISGAGSFAASDALFISFTPSGNDGTGTGNVSTSGSPTTGNFATWASGTTINSVTAAQATALLNSFVASGAGHLKGLVPDPGSSAGTTKFLREDATWQIPASAGAFQNVNWTASDTWTVPATGWYYWEVQGGGGGGGGTGTGTFSVGGGGGSGGPGFKYLQLTAGDTITITIGAAGTGGASGGANIGIGGGGTTVASANLGAVFCQGTGGSGGVGTNTSAAVTAGGGAPGTGNSSNIAMLGQGGSPGYGISAALFFGGTGGHGMLGGGGSGASNPAAAGSDSSFNSGGGGGGAAGPSKKGGDGAGGFARVFYVG